MTIAAKHDVFFKIKPVSSACRIMSAYDVLRFTEVLFAVDGPGL